MFSHRTNQRQRSACYRAASSLFGLADRDELRNCSLLELIRRLASCLCDESTHQRWRGYTNTWTLSVPTYLGATSGGCIALQQILLSDIAMTWADGSFADAASLRRHMHLARRTPSMAASSCCAARRVDLSLFLPPEKQPRTIPEAMMFLRDVFRRRLAEPRPRASVVYALCCSTSAAVLNLDPHRP